MEAQVRDDLARIAVDAKNRTKLSKVFNRELDRIISESSETRERELARRVFSFVRDAARPLTVAELEELTAWDCATKTLRRDQARAWHEIRRICLGLIEVDEFGYVQYGNPTWYLSSGDDETRKKLPNSHAELGRTCVQYLSQEVFSSGAFSSSAERESRFFEYPLLPYASKYWAWHFNPLQRNGPSPDDLDFKTDALRFLRSDTHVEFSLQMARREDPLLVDWWQTIQIFAKTDATMFHEQPVARMAVGLFDQLQGDIEESEDLDPFFPCRTTGMHWSCRQGLESLVLGLLYPGSESEEKAFDCKDKQQRTPLHVAAAFKHQSIVQMLLERGAHPDPRDKFGYSPLMAASQNGAVDIVRDLLKSRDVDINAQTTPPCSIYKRSALHIAASQGHIDVAKELLDHPHIDVNLRDSHGNAPLHLATKMGDQAMIRLFLSSDKPFNVGSPVRCHSVEEAAPWCRFCGCTSLHLAALDKKSTDIVRAFLPYYQQLRNVVDNYHRTPLHCAARMEALENVKALLDHDPQQVNAVDRSGWPPFAEAIKARNIQICRLLWNQPEFDKTIQSKNGVTLLEYAQICGNSDIVDLIKGDKPALSRHGSLDDSRSPKMAPLPDEELSLQHCGQGTVRRASPSSPQVTSAIRDSPTISAVPNRSSPSVGSNSSPALAPTVSLPSALPSSGRQSSPIEIPSHRRNSSGARALLNLDGATENGSMGNSIATSPRSSTLNDMSTSPRSNHFFARNRRDSVQNHRSASKEPR